MINAKENIETLNNMGNFRVYMSICQKFHTHIQHQRRDSHAQQSSLSKKERK